MNNELQNAIDRLNDCVCFPGSGINGHCEAHNPNKEPSFARLPDNAPSRKSDLEFIESAVKLVQSKCTEEVLLIRNVLSVEAPVAMRGINYTEYVYASITWHDDRGEPGKMPGHEYGEWRIALKGFPPKI